MGRHVLLTTDVVGGVWDFCLALTRQLVGSQQARVSLLALGSPSDSQRRQAREAGAHLIAEPLKLEWMNEATADVQHTRELVSRLARDLRAEVVHANQFATACADVDVPTILTLHSDVLSWRRWTRGAHDLPAEWRPYHALVREALDRADAVVAVSRFLAEEVRDLYACDRQIKVIHNGWPAPAHPATGAAAARGRVTLLAGRVWDAAKNVALAATAARGWDHGQVRLAGEQQHPDGGHAAVPSPLEPLGYLDRPTLDAHMRRARVYLSPARYDPFGLLPLQAAMNGCALLLSDIPSYRELWAGAAAFFRPDDADDLRRAWARLLDQPAAAADLAGRAQARAAERYTVATMACAYAATYAGSSTRQHLSV